MRKLISRFKMAYVGEEPEISFLCERCARDGGEFSYDTYNRPMREIHQPGECISCNGIGFSPLLENVLCLECKGSGICSNCNGKYYRDWSDLSPDLQERFSENWEKVDDLSYASMAGFYRKW